MLRRLPSGAEVLANGRAPGFAEVMRLPTLAGTLREIAEGGRDAFYEGALASRTAEFVSQHGGCLSPADFASHCSTWDDPIRTDYRDVTVWECPPNGQGLAALLALNIAEGFRPQRHGSAERGLVPSSDRGHAARVRGRVSLRRRPRAGARAGTGAALQGVRRAAPGIGPARAGDGGGRFRRSRRGERHRLPDGGGRRGQRLLPDQQPLRGLRERTGGARHGDGDAEPRRELPRSIPLIPTPSPAASVPTTRSSRRSPRAAASCG